jgi:hypothetical protein
MLNRHSPIQLCTSTSPIRRSHKCTYARVLRLYAPLNYEGVTETALVADTPMISGTSHYQVNRVCAHTHPYTRMQVRVLFTTRAHNGSLRSRQMLDAIKDFNENIEHNQQTLSDNGSFVPYLSLCDDFCYRNMTCLKPDASIF